MATRKKTWKELRSAISKTMRLWGVKQHTVDPESAPARRDRYHTYGQRKVTIRFTVYGKLVVLCSTMGSLAHDNLEMLAQTVETLRLSKYRKIEDLLIAAYRQIDPLPVAPRAPALDPADPYAVLGVGEHYTLTIIEAIWKAHLRVEHPDAGGNADRAKALNAAMDKIRKQKGDK